MGITFRSETFFFFSINLRTASTACIEDNLAWASSTFPVNDFRSRSTSRSQTLGKHKLSNSDLKASKSKHIKPTVENGELRHLTSEPLFQSLPMVSCRDQIPRLDPLTITPPVPPDVEAYNPECSSGTCNQFFEDFDMSEMVAHNYEPDLISGLEEYLSLSDFTDIG